MTKWTAALQALETSLHSTFSEVTIVARATQANAENFLNEIKNGGKALPYILLVISDAVPGDMGSDAAPDLRGSVNLYYIRNGGLTSAEQSTWKRIEDWAGDKQDALRTCLWNWTEVASGPFWVDQPQFDSTASNPANEFLFDKANPFYALAVSADFEVGAGS